jgi:hypothetical protein
MHTVLDLVFDQGRGGRRRKSSGRGRPSEYFEPLLRREDTFLGHYSGHYFLFYCALGEPDMPKNARVAVAARTSAVAPAQSDSSQLVTIALFSGIGLLASLIAILMGVPIVGY